VEFSCAHPKGLARGCSRPNGDYGRNCSHGAEQTTTRHLRVQPSQQKDSGIKLMVMDQQGAVIPKAEIVVEGKSIKEPIAGITGPSGEWIQPKLAAGRYKVTVKAQGFSTLNSVV
jgi:hypothetical protein